MPTNGTAGTLSASFLVSSTFWNSCASAAAGARQHDRRHRDDLQQPGQLLHRRCASSRSSASRRSSASSARAFSRRMRSASRIPNTSAISANDAQNAGPHAGIQRAHHRGLRVNRAPDVDALVDQRHVDRREQPQRRRQPPAARPAVLAREQVGDQRQEQQQRRGQARVPLPVDAPGLAPPQRTADQHAHAEQHAQLARRRRQPIARLRALEQVGDAAARAHEGRDEQHDRARHVEVEDLLHHAHDRLQRGRRDQLRHDQEAGGREERRGQKSATEGFHARRILRHNPHERRLSRFRVPRRPAHRRHLRHHRGGALGFRSGDPDWCNLGQGQPETGALPGAPARIEDVTIAVGDQEYAPVAGHRGAARGDRRALQPPLPARHAVAVQRRERQRLGRRARGAHARGGQPRARSTSGHFLPDYTAYEELLDIFKAFTPIPILLEGDRGYAFSVEDLRREVHGRGLSALLLSNPCNPTGKLVQGDELGRWVDVARELDCALLIDEFYSHYIWTGRPGQLPVESAARYVEDVDARSGGDLRRPHQELALPGLARDLDRRAAQRDRRGRQRRLVPRRRRLGAAAARGDPAAGRRARRRRDQRDPDACSARSATACSPGSSASACAPTARPTARSTSGARSTGCRRRSTTAWASSAPRSRRR